MCGAVVYLIVATLSWIGVAIWKCAKHIIRIPTICELISDEILPLCDARCSSSAVDAAAMVSFEGDSILEISGDPWGQCLAAHAPYARRCPPAAR